MRAHVGMWTLVSTLAACGATAPPPPSPPVAIPKAGPAHYRYRQLRTGRTHDQAARTSFDLTIDGHDATLVEADEVAPARSIGEADAATWVARSTRTYRGTVRDDHGALAVELTSAGVQPLALRCARASIDVAVAGAIRVATARGTGEACGDASAWQPPTRAHVDVLRCGEAIQPAVDTGDDDDQLTFAALPGVEFAHQNDRDCAIQGGGLRVAR